MNDIDTRALVDRIKALEAKVAAQTPREFAPRPYAPAFDPLERMLREVQPWMRDAVAAVPDKLMREIVADNVKAASAPAPVEAPKARGSGWIEPRPLRQPDGLQYVDAIAEHFLPTAKGA